MCKGIKRFSRWVDWFGERGGRKFRGNVEGGSENEGLF